MASANGGNGVAALVAEGKSNKEIANDLMLSEKTIKNHLRNIYYKMGVNDRTNAAIKGIKDGVIELDPDHSLDI